MVFAVKHAKVQKPYPETCPTKIDMKMMCVRFLHLLNALDPPPSPRISPEKGVEECICGFIAAVLYL